MGKMKIDGFVMYGNINNAGIDRIRRLLPKTIYGSMTKLIMNFNTMRSRLLIICLLFFFVSVKVASQPYTAFKLSTNRPEAGKKISFIYSGIFSDKIDPRITLYYSGPSSGWLTLKAKFDGKHTVGSFVIPDSVLAISIVPRNSRDSNEVFTFPLYNQGKLLKGALASAARFNANTSPEYQDLEGVKKAREGFLREFKTNPELKPVWLLKYYETGSWFPDAAINMLFNQTWRDSLVGGKSQRFLTDMYYLGMRFRELDTKSLLKADLLAKYPQGEVAFTDASAEFGDKFRNGEYDDGLRELENRFTELQRQGKFDRLYLEGFKVNLNKLDLVAAERFLGKIKSDEIKRDGFLTAARTLSKKKEYLAKAESYSKSALALLNSSNYSMPYYVFDKLKWLKEVEGIKGSYLGLLAEIQHEQGNNSAALENLSVAEKINDWDEQIRENYVQYLLEAGMDQRALEVCLGYIKADKGNDVLKELFLKAYAKLKGDQKAAEVYYAELMKEVNRKYALRNFSMLNVRGRDFTLKDRNDQPVTYQTGKRKAAVLYFFSPNYNSAERTKFNEFFNKMAVRYAGRKDIVFLGIDKTQIFESDENKRSRLRKQKLREFMEQYNYKFDIVLDEMVYNPKNSNGTYFVVSDKYSCEYLCQFYMIGKDGIVRYKHFPPGISTSEKFEREFSVALNLIIK
jgi:peroxiredoxin